MLIAFAYFMDVGFYKNIFFGTAWQFKLVPSPAFAIVVLTMFFEGKFKMIKTLKCEYLFRYI